ncbi:MAG: cysteine--tRNA ligase [Nanoarchaeota archaeon]
MALKVFDSLTRGIVEFKPIGDVVGLYTCGPTVYNVAHIGNFRAYVFEDILRRYLKLRGFKVKQVMNLTDVDDKTIRDSLAQGVPLADFTRKYKDAFFDDVRTLGIEPAEVYPEATRHIGEMIQIIEVLFGKGLAYKGDDGSVYFSIGKFHEYGKLAHVDLSALKAGARVKQDEYEKESASDFALWKAWDESDGDVKWQSPWGQGRPGWHIECSAMSMKHLSDAFASGTFDPSRFRTIDIHTGGVDNLFPHHEDEIAQSQGATGKQFVKYWMHCEHLIVNGKKMSKSLGNFFTLRDLIEKGYDPKAIRYALIAGHYRQQLNFTFEGLHAAKQAVDRLQEFVDKLMIADGAESDLAVKVDEAERRFIEAMDNDLNTPNALIALFDFVRETNQMIAGRHLSAENARHVLALVRRIDSVLGLLSFEQDPLDPALKALIERREAARKTKDWALADRIRDELKEKGIVIDDTEFGVKWKRP